LFRVGALNALLMIGSGQFTRADDNSMGISNKKVIQTAFDAWQNGNGSVFDLLAPDAKWTIIGNSPVSRTFISKQEFLDLVITPFNKRMSRPLKPKAPLLFADGDTVIALFDADGVALDAKPYRNTYAWFMQMRAGKIVQVTAFFDTIEFTDFWKRISTP
jgi:ketosteroid isomerase-like protein